MNRHASALLAALLLASCTAGTGRESPADRVVRIATEYVDGYYHQFPEEAYEIGYPDTPMDRLGDRSAAAMEAWRAREDSWLAELTAVDPASLEGTEAAVPHAFAVDRLTASRDRRVCRTELWNVSPTWTGWQSMIGSTFAIQPVATAAERTAALDRLRDVPRYLDTEIANLRAGMATGFLAARPDVERVVSQLDDMLTSSPEDSPFHAPAARWDDAAFREEVLVLVTDVIHPAAARYRNFLVEEYTPRDQVGVSANPDGEECYAASVRFHTSLDLDARAIHETGLVEMERIEDEMKAIARRSFGTDDVRALLERLRSDDDFTFGSEDEVLAYARSAVDRAASRIAGWVGFVPDAEVAIRPFPAYLKASGGGFYSSGSTDGARPGTYELGTWRPETISRAGHEATTFHETYPGHHLQMSVAIYGKGVHPLLRYMYVASMAEGWGLYSELLADEMGLYSSDVDRLGMLSNQALRAARLVVDPGMHVLGWTRDRAVRYMVEHTVEAPSYVESEIDRYLAVPAQATSYMLGSIEIQRLRARAEETLGDRFDIRGFHDVLLADGAVSLPMLRAAVERWMAERAAEAGS